MACRISILLPPLGLYPDLGSMLAEAFRELGLEPTVRHRVHPEALDADVLLMGGLCRHIDDLPALLRQRKGKSPVTILWQLEPLPPPQMSAHGESVGTRMAKWDWAGLPRTRRLLLQPFIPFRTKLLRGLHRWLARSYAAEVLRSPDQQGWLEYYPENHFAAMAEWQWIKTARAAGWVDHCFATVQTRVQFLRSRGLNADLIPFGYHPKWGRDRRMTRDIDVLFLGRLGHGPRETNVNWLQAELQRRGRLLTWAQRAFGDAREELLSRTKIMLSLLRVPHDEAGMRVLIGLAGGALVVSEACADAGEFVPGKHYVTAPLRDIPSVVEYYLDHERERRTIAAEGHRFATEELTLPQVLRRMLQLAGIEGPR